MANILDVLSLALFYGFDKETEHTFRELDLQERTFQEFDLKGYFTRGREYLYLYNGPNDNAQNVLRQLLTRLKAKGLQHVFVLRDNQCFLLDLTQQTENLESLFDFSQFITF